ncbi:MAG: hypothetical protein CFH10_01808 [Alphaproteobacteria bacterium MarineAlpha4_Bin2]|nr:MAG: hypothetical protein CFH10_01808 [Alphaproteobacteria bacterium MarineAlpha4_Bin2]
MWADVILQSRKTHGFGTTFNALEVLRRLHPDKRILYFAFNEKGNHNRKLGMIFGDTVRFFSIQRPELIFHKFLGKPVIMPPRWLHDRIAVALNRIWIATFAKKTIETYKDPLALYDHLYEVLGRKGLLPASVIKQDNWNIDGAIGLLIENYSAEPLCLPDEIRREIYSQIDRQVERTSKTQIRFCGIWFKMDPPTEKLWKNGSSVDHYVAAIELILDAGYVVLWHGDRPLPTELRRRFSGCVFDHCTLNLDKDIFNLFVPTEADIFIGDSGPGTWMAGLMGTATLGLNLYPIGVAIGIDWSYFKNVVDGKGNKVPYDELLPLCPPAYDKAPEDWRSTTMDTKEIREAVEAFLANPRPVGNDPHAWVLELLPEWSSLRMTRKGRLSPAWIRHNQIPRMRAASRTQNLVSENC